MGFADKLKNAFKSDGKKQQKQESVVKEEIIQEKSGTDKISSRNNFTYLVSLVESSDDIVNLDKDIVLEDGEDAMYSNGIVILQNNFIIDGHGHSIDARGKNLIFRIQGHNVQLKNMTLKNGHCDAGSAVLNFGSSTIENIHFIHNSGLQGGALNNQPSGEMAIKSCRFEDNNCEKNGGAAFNMGKMDVMDCVFIENSASDGAGLCNGPNGTCKIENCEFENNNAVASGGGVSNHSTMTLKNSNFSSNKAQQGAGLDNLSNSQVTMDDCTFRQNKSNDAGGAIFNWSKMTLNNPIFADNVSRSCGGIWNIGDGHVIINGGKFEGNIGNTVAGAILNDGKLELNGTDFTNNVLKMGNGGAILSKKGSSMEDIVSKVTEGEKISLEDSNNLKLNECTFKDNKPDNIHYG